MIPEKSLQSRDRVSTTQAPRQVPPEVGRFRLRSFFSKAMFKLTN